MLHGPLSPAPQVFPSHQPQYIYPFTILELLHLDLNLIFYFDNFHCWRENSQSRFRSQWEFGWRHLEGQDINIDSHWWKEDITTFWWLNWCFKTYAPFSVEKYCIYCIFPEFISLLHSIYMYFNKFYISYLFLKFLLKNTSKPCPNHKLLGQILPVFNHRLQANWINDRCCILQ